MSEKFDHAKDCLRGLIWSNKSKVKQGFLHLLFKSIQIKKDFKKKVKVSKKSSNSCVKTGGTERNIGGSNPPLPIIKNNIR